MDTCETILTFLLIATVLLNTWRTIVLQMAIDDLRGSLDALDTALWRDAKGASWLAESKISSTPNP